MNIKDEELVHIALNGFTTPWEAFVEGLCGREHKPTFEKLWDNFI